MNINKIYNLHDLIVLLQVVDLKDIIIIIIIIFIWTDFDREHNPDDDKKINFHDMHVAGARIVFTGFEEFAWIH